MRKLSTIITTTRLSKSSTAAITGRGCLTADRRASSLSSSSRFNKQPGTQLLHERPRSWKREAVVVAVALRRDSRTSRARR